MTCGSPSGRPRRCVHAFPPPEREKGTRAFGPHHPPSGRMSQRSHGQRVLPRADQELHELLGVRRLAQFELNENAFSKLIK
jgi:hypothetical protein